MPRLGGAKAKTECVAFKIRRVKCDEACPACTRRIDTGRKCDGCATSRAGAYMYSCGQLLRPRPPPTQPAPDAELRGVAFYRRNVAPRLAGPLDSYFWTHLVPQVSYHEPAAKYAALAISSLYEELNKDGSIRPGERNTFAIAQYNEAVRHLVTAKSHETVLFVCILFLCIEMLRGDLQNAVDHCRHGIIILNGIKCRSNFIKDHLESAFYRIGVFPLFFGVSPHDFPVVNISFTVPTPPFRSLLDAQTALESLMSRSIRLTRLADGYRLGDETCPGLDAAKTQEREDIETSLEAWLVEFQAFRKRKTVRKYSLDAMRDSVAERLFEAKCLASQILVATCFVREESVYDSHLDKFRGIVELAEQAEAVLRQTWKNYPRAKFTFEVGFTPPLAITVIKCRSLEVRAAATRLVRAVCHEKENMWERSTVLAFVGQVAKFEHGLQFGLDEYATGVTDNGTLPPEERRIRDSRLDHNSPLMTAKYGAATV
ncbi:C6 zinc finger protein [Colletotrichum falcatum]|nr:C6 zinc finger protein [Colletotrichum falcatum]